MITASWIPSGLNKRANRRSCQRPNSSEWELSSHIFQQIANLWGLPEVDCFVSRIMKKHPWYMSLNPDPECIATNALYQDLYLFPSFCLIGRVLKEEVQTQSVSKALLIAPLWPGQPWFPTLLKMVIATPRLLPPSRELLRNNLIH